MDTLDMFSTPPEHGKPIKIENGEYIYIPNFYDKPTADKYLKRLIEDIKWKQESMNMYGKEIPFPRLTSWYGDQDKPYSFSGITLQPHPWSPGLLKVKKDIELKANVIFNSVLLNRYRDGSDSISWHTDAEKELGENPVIASVNFGAERKFQLKHKDTNERIDIILQHGSLLIMQGELQHYWKHQIPKTKKPLGERVNLTFRVIK
ncbi:alpha-ketoglutarate-dependent dioxygenase AlkB family protein [Polaribacter atrinae]|uniref:alpha-ketoglutarate-dependent dioxygenase AlkB family protein n=1 Tax=Polaribacter atrinae TaxID=1333662 RepID=UPI0030F6FF1F